MIAVTASAVEKLRNISATDVDMAGMALRVAVRPGGCSGFSYEMFFDGDREATDLVENFDGVDVVVDEASAQLLVGATLDYNDGLNQSGFKIDNPSASRTCGCGQSFS